MGKLQIFEIFLDNGKSVFNPSEFVSGRCIVDLRGDMKLKSLKILMKGVAKVHWSTTRRVNNRTETRHYRAEIEYFENQSLLFGGGDGNKVLKDGRHEFQFTLRLPLGEIPTSFEGQYGSIRYWLQAEMKIPWSFNLNTKKAFTVISPTVINRQEYLAPVGNNAEKTLCCSCFTSESISLQAYTDRRGYCPGESVTVSADIENISDRIIRPRAALYQRQTFFASGATRSHECKYTVVEGAEIQPKQTTRWDFQLFIPVLTPSITDCSIISVDYVVKITLNIPGAINLRMDLPVIIGTMPLQAFNYGDLNNIQEGVGCFASAPKYSELDDPPLISMSPPSYADCVGGSVNIADDDDNIMGDTKFTPKYPYVQNYHH